MATSDRLGIPSDRHEAAPHDPGAAAAGAVRANRKVVRKAAFAGAVGSFVEWYDYGIYGLLVTYLAINIMGEADAGNLFLTNVGFLVSFIARPFGSVICGYLGDRIGRKGLLATLLVLISAATAAIGLIPSHAVIGVGAPILLVLLRVLQGFSAGGEVAGAMSFVGEYAPDARRNYMMSFIAVGSFVALMSGSAFSAVLITALGDDAMTSWAWRVPFLLAVPLGYIGFHIRRRLEETPHFTALREQNTVARNPLKDTFTSRRHLKAIALTIFLPALNGPHYTFNGSVNTVVQDAALAAVENCAEDVARMRAAYQERRDIMRDALAVIPGLTLSAPEGAFYRFPRYDLDLPSVEVVAALRSHGVAVRPGSEFGACGENHLRLSYAASPQSITEGVRRLADGFAALR